MTRLFQAMTKKKFEQKNVRKEGQIVRLEDKVLMKKYVLEL